MKRDEVSVLRVLLSTDHEVPVHELAAATGLDRKALDAALSGIAGAGIEWENHPHRGLRILRLPGQLIPEEIAARRSVAAPSGAQILVFRETTSTNDQCMRLGNDGVPEGTAVFAESQTAGRGRHGRVWASAEGEGLWFSVLFRPEWDKQHWTRLTLCAALAVHDAIVATTGIKPLIKWPNDILLRERKVAGILLESRMEAGAGGFVVVGIGLNVNQRAFPDELAEIATSLCIETGRGWRRAELAAALLDALQTRYEQATHEFPDILDACSRHSATLGRRVSIRQGNEWVEGRAIRLDGNGGLIIELEDRSLRTMTSGEVTSH